MLMKILKVVLFILGPGFIWWGVLAFQGSIGMLRGSKETKRLDGIVADRIERSPPRPGEEEYMRTFYAADMRSHEDAMRWPAILLMVVSIVAIIAGVALALLWSFLIWRFALGPLLEGAVLLRVVRREGFEPPKAEAASSTARCN